MEKIGYNKWIGSRNQNILLIGMKLSNIINIFKTCKIENT